MSDKDVAALLDSSEALVVIEAPAGCGKTYQGANYARRAALASSRGRTLILTHTHSACAQFAKETRAVSGKLEIKTIDSLVVQAARVYHKSLGLPPDPSAWAREQGNDGFKQLGTHVASLLEAKPMIAAALADRYPVIIADEHQDSHADQHSIVMALHRAGSRLRVFGDPMQAIYARGQKAVDAARAQWDMLKTSGTFGELTHPHRWRSGSPNLGDWILQARETLKSGGPVDISGALPPGLSVIAADNTAQSRAGYSMSRDHRRPVDNIVNSAQSILVLSSQNDTVNALRAFWNRRLPIWEGHTREPLGKLVTALTQKAGEAPAVAGAAVTFIEEVCKGFSRSSHGDRFLQEIVEGCRKAATGKPALIQELARYILVEPNHAGVARCLKRLEELVENKTSGFTDVCIDYRNEFRDAIKLEHFIAPEDGLGEINRRRTYARPMPPSKSISTIHKAKGLECDNALLIPCDKVHFPGTDAARCKLYVALSRARRSLTLVVSAASPSPLLKIG
ncbi:MAG TPA: AAA family ATPase [Gammaproteobacteria bacterium]|nr:AAA family ATPase [Gammaproteobacteria bacterium]